MSDISIMVDLVHMTEDAILVYDGTQEVWVPKSLIVDPSSFELLGYDEYDSFELTIPEWLAIDKEMI